MYRYKISKPNTLVVCFISDLFLSETMKMIENSLQWKYGTTSTNRYIPVECSATSYNQIGRNSSWSTFK